MKIYTGPRGGKYTLSKTGKKEYLPKQRKVSRKIHYCGPAGGAARTSYPVNTQARCRAALSYARFAKRPCGIIRCAMKQAKKKGWSCGTTSKRVLKCNK